MGATIQLFTNYFMAQGMGAEGATLAASQFYSEMVEPGTVVEAPVEEMIELEFISNPPLPLWERAGVRGIEHKILIVTQKTRALLEAEFLANWLGIPPMIAVAQPFGPPAAIGVAAYFGLQAASDAQGTLFAASADDSPPASGGGEAVVFKHPITGQDILGSVLTEDMVRKLVRDMRYFIGGKQQSALKRYRNGEDRKTLAAEILADVDSNGETYRAMDMLDEILVWVAKNNLIARGPFFLGSLAHRVNRIFGDYRFLGQELDEKGELVDAPGDIFAAIHPPLEGLIQILKEQFAAYLKAKGVHFVTGDLSLSPLNNDKSVNFKVLEEILEELIRNAVKYCDKEISIEWDASDNALVITNDGPGIPSTIDPFEAGKRGNLPGIAGMKNSGFGLYNAKNDAVSQGWQLTYTSRPGQTEFRLKFPPKEIRLMDIVDADEAGFAAAVEKLRRLSVDEALDASVQLGDATDEIVRRLVARLSVPDVDAEAVKAVGRDFKAASYAPRLNKIANALQPSLTAKKHCIWAALWSSTGQMLPAFAGHLLELNDRIAMDGFDSDSVREWLERIRRLAEASKRPVLDGRGYAVTISRSELSNSLLHRIEFSKAEKRWDGDDIVFVVSADSKIDGSFLGIEATSWSEDVPNDFALKRYLEFLGWTMKVTPAGSDSYEVRLNFGI